MALPPPSYGSTVLVTGASSGIGADLARQLAARGYNVTVVARRKEKLVPGMLNKAVSTSGRFIPRTVLLPLAQRVSRSS